MSSDPAGATLDLGKVTTGQVPSADEAEKDPRTKEETSYEAKLKDLEIKSLGQDIEERKKYADKIFLLIAFWLIGIFLILVFVGHRLWGFTLSDNVLMALIGGTTVNVLGLFLVVVNYLFPKKS